MSCDLFINLLLLHEALNSSNSFEDLGLTAAVALNILECDSLSIGVLSILAASSSCF